MTWKTGVISALAGTLSVVGVNSYFNGFSMIQLIVVGAATVTCILGLSYVISANKAKRH